MFSGIAAGSFVVAALRKQQGYLRLSIDMPEALIEGLTLGASVAVDGVCLTVVAVESSLVSFDVIDATLACTTLGDLAVGHTVNIERSLRFGAEVGGHLVEGHVLGVATLLAIEEHPETRSLYITCPVAWMKYLGRKGYVAINGISLTVADLWPKEGRFLIHLIPETLRITNLSRLAIGGQVNLEVDARHRAIVDTVEQWFATSCLVS